MNSTVRTIVIVAALAVALAAGYLLGKGGGAGSEPQTAASPEGGEPAKAGRTQDPVLPQSDGPARHLADPEEGPDGDGLRPSLRR